MIAEPAAKLGRTRMLRSVRSQAEVTSGITVHMGRLISMAEAMCMQVWLKHAQDE